MTPGRARGVLLVVIGLLMMGAVAGIAIHDDEGEGTGSTAAATTTSTVGAGGSSSTTAAPSSSTPSSATTTSTTRIGAGANPSGSGATPTTTTTTVAGAVSGEVVTGGAPLAFTGGTSNGGLGLALLALAVVAGWVARPSRAG